MGPGGSGPPPCLCMVRSGLSSQAATGAEWWGGEAYGDELKNFRQVKKAMKMILKICRINSIYSITYIKWRTK